MKNLNNVTFVLLLMIGLFAISCKNEDFIEEPILQADTSNLIDFKGLPVNHRFDTPIEYLEIEHTRQFLKQMYGTLKFTVGKRKSGTSKTSSEDLPDAKAMLEGAKEVLDQFPYQKIQEEDEYETQGLDSIQIAELEQQYLIEQEEKAQVNWEMIKQDFPTLTERKIQDNIEIIDEYYEQNLNYAVLNQIANNTDNYAKSPSNKKSHFQRGLVPCIIDHVGIGLKYGFIRSPIAILIATEQAETTSSNYYNNIGVFSVGSGDTVRNAYKHIAWSALLAQHYFTISSKARRLSFSKTVTDLHESCGSNPVDSSQMDYHNNAIGREIWNENTSYRKIFGLTIGLRRTSVSNLKRIARERIDNSSCFIVKKEEDRFPENLLSQDKTDLQIRDKILETNDDFPVYFIGPMISSRYVYRYIFSHYEYEECNYFDSFEDEDGIDGFDDVVGLCKRPVYRRESQEVVPCYKL